MNRNLFNKDLKRNALSFALLGHGHYVVGFIDHGGVQYIH